MKLAVGRFYGTSLKSRTVPGFVLNEVIYDPNLVLPKHSHERAYFSFVSRGGYQERCGRCIRDCEPATAVFHPTGEVHADRFFGAGGHLFNLEIDPLLLESVKDSGVSQADATYFNGGRIVKLGFKLSIAAKVPGEREVGRMQDLAFEILAELYKSKYCSESKPPRWLDTVTEVLHARFHEPLSLAVVSTCVGFHPVHVARVFRRHYRCSIREYLWRLRIGFSCRQIAKGDLRLVDIALTAGFCDQSHFSKIFKRSTGMSPAQFRDRLGSL